MGVRFHHKIAATTVIAVAVSVGAFTQFGMVNRTTDAVENATTTSSTTTTTTIPAPVIEDRWNSWNMNTTTTAPPTPEEIVNGIVYIHNNPEPAMQAFRIVAKARGWSDDEIAKWESFASNVMLHESGYCYNLRRGAIVGKAEGCIMAKQGKYEDSGFAQLIRIHYGPGNWLCEQEKLCSSDDIIATPWNSMTAFLALLERNGKQPWCFTDALRATARCQNAPKSPPSV